MVPRDHQRFRAAAPLEVGRHLRDEASVLGAVDPLSQLRRAADLRPPRHERCLEARAAGLVGVLVGIDLNAAVSRLLNIRDQRLRETPARRSERFHVRNDGGQLRLVSDTDDFVDGGHDADRVIGFIADVALVHSAELGCDLRERDHLVDFGVAAGRVVEARRQPYPARFHSGARQCHHPIELGRRRRSIAHAEHLAPDRSVRNVQRDVHADASFVPGALRGEIHRPASVGIEHNRRQPLGEKLPAFFEAPRQTCRRVRMHVDESGGDGQAGGVDDSCCPRTAEPSHCRDTAVLDRDVSRLPRVPAAVEDTAVADQHIVN